MDDISELQSVTDEEGYKTKVFPKEIDERGMYPKTVAMGVAFSGGEDHIPVTHLMFQGYEKPLNSHTEVDTSGPIVTYNIALVDGDIVQNLMRSVLASFLSSGSLAIATQMITQLAVMDSETGATPLMHEALHKSVEEFALQHMEEQLTDDQA